MFLTPMVKMNKMRKIIFLLLGIGFVSILLSCGSTQRLSDYSDEEIIQSVRDRDFVFVANRMMPYKGRSFNLNSYYDVVVATDTLKSFLPYFGRAYVAPIYPGNGGINFTSTNFEFRESRSKGGAIEIEIRPKDETEVQSLLFSIFDNGSASLRVTLLNRTPVSYDGYVIPRKPPAEKTQQP
jgi:hypothetical protein